MNQICTSTNTKVTNLTGTTKFMCPNCGKYEIIRSKKAREIVIKYKCPECGFEGPN